MIEFTEIRCDMSGALYAVGLGLLVEIYFVHRQQCMSQSTFIIGRMGCHLFHGILDTI